MKKDFELVLYYISLGYSLEAACDRAERSKGGPPTDTMKRVRSVRVTMADGTSVEAFKDHVITRH